MIPNNEKHSKRNRAAMDLTRDESSKDGKYRKPMKLTGTLEAVRKLAKDAFDRDYAVFTEEVTEESGFSFEQRRLEPCEMGYATMDLDKYNSDARYKKAYDGRKVWFENGIKGEDKKTEVRRQAFINAKKVTEAKQNSFWDALQET